MSLGPLFTISSINVARAAVRKAEAHLPLDAPVEITVGAHDPTDSNRLHVAVTGLDGHVREVAVDPAAVRACVETPANIGAAQCLVDDLAGRITDAVHYQHLRRTLLEDREHEGSPWMLWSTAAEIYVMREVGLTWYEISEAIDLALFSGLDPDSDNLDEELAEMHRSLVTNEPVMLVAARSIVDDEALVERTEPGVAVDLDRGRVWQLTTEQDTRIVIDLRADGPRWMRISAEHDEQRTNQYSDRKWKRLMALVPEGMMGSDDLTGLPPGMARRVIIGQAADLYIGLREWWTTTRVVHVRQLSSEELLAAEMSPHR